MARDMLIFPTFKISLDTSAKIMKPFNLNLIELVTVENEEDMKRHMSLCLMAMGVIANYHILLK